jgi:para-aminobenzoate synthetase component 1
MPRVFINNLVKQIKNFVPNISQSEEIKLKQRVSKIEYQKNVKEIINHIHKGDIYEMNYCIEFFSDFASIDPVTTYKKLNNISPAPFSCFIKLYDKYLMSASPERFLAKNHENIISQPIKGTIKRGKTPDEDLELIKKLRNDPKEISENVMIVDLVRNDLSKNAEIGSVEVDELLEVYTYAQVHQLISTIKATIKTETSFFEAIKNCFPMGSMTGAPKVKAMKLIEKYESTKRGLYSGAVGYISPYRTFDFNVVIRSILYNKSNKYISFMVGSAITANSDPDKEYQECILKAEAMLQTLI